MTISKKIEQQILSGETITMITQQDSVFYDECRGY